MNTAGLISKAKLPTRYGEFTMFAFKDGGNGHAVLLNDKGKRGKTAVRIHSKCLTGDVFRSLRCDCGEQLDESLKRIGRGGGVLIYLDQEGRGIGLENKIKAYALQDTGLDTYEANKFLGFGDDERDYGVVLDILKALGVNDIKLFTNNPEKIKFLECNGIRVERVPLVVKPNKHNSTYLRAKQTKSGHLL